MPEVKVADKEIRRYNAHSGIVCSAQTAVEMAARDGSDSARISRCNCAGKLFILTFLFAMVAEVLVYIPSVTKFRLNWLSDRLAAARNAILAIEATPSAMVPENPARQVLDEIAVNAIALKGGQTRRVLSFTDMMPKIVENVDIRNLSEFESVTEAFSTLLRRENEFIRVAGSGPMNDQQIEIVIATTPLRHAMLQFSANILFASLFIATFTAALVYVSARRFIFVRGRRGIE